MTVGLDQQVGNVYEQPQRKSSSPITGAIGTGALAGAGVAGYNYFKNNPLKGAGADEFVKSVASNNKLKKMVPEINDLTGAFQTLSFKDGAVQGVDKFADALKKTGADNDDIKGITDKFKGIANKTDFSKAIGGLGYSNNLNKYATGFTSIESLNKERGALTSKMDGIKKIDVSTLTDDNFLKTLQDNQEALGIKLNDKNTKNLTLDKAKKIIDRQAENLDDKLFTLDRFKKDIEDGATNKLNKIWDGKAFKDLGDKPLDSVKQYADDIKGAIKKVNWKKAGKAGLIAGGIAAGAAFLWNMATGKQD